MDIGVGMIFAFMLSLCVGGLLAWGWTLYRLWNRLPVYAPESRLPANWGFPEVLLCLGVYILLTAMAGIIMVQAGFELRPAEAVAVATGEPATVAEATDDAEATAETEISADTEAADDETPATPSASNDPVRLGALITVDGVARLLTIGLVLMLLFLQDRRIVQRFGWLPRWRDIALGLVASCMLLPLVFGIQAALSVLVPYEHAVLEIISEGPPVWVLYAMAFTSMIVAPLVEEFFFRGVLQGWFQRLAAPSPSPRTTFAEGSQDVSALPAAAQSLESPYAPPQPDALATATTDWIEGTQIARWPWWPILLSSLLFALVHLGQGAAPIALFFLALGLGYLYRITGRLWPSITVHFVLNSISTLMTVLAS